MFGSWERNLSFKPKSIQQKQTVCKYTSLVEYTNSLLQHSAPTIKINSVKIHLNYHLVFLSSLLPPPPKKHILHKLLPLGESFQIVHLRIITANCSYSKANFPCKNSESPETQGFCFVALYIFFLTGKGGKNPI